MDVSLRIWGISSSGEFSTNELNEVGLMSRTPRECGKVKVDGISAASQATH